ncbi:hypothetical protein [Actinomadura atramentaria]|uniref:hypothetical protein n=1 Tax=Actinomadura atramentaria TaxID=1990 RepID=UPI0003792ACE|nr:hypothetical protein [Actinomadura atramentaria]
MPRKDQYGRTVRKLRSKASSPGKAIYEALTNRSPKSEPVTSQDQARELQKRHGSAAAAAKAVGVSKRTMERWISGKQAAKNTARAKNADKLTQEVRRSRIRPGRGKDFAASGTKSGSQDGPRNSGLSIKGYFQISQRIEYRSVHLGPYTPPHEMQQLIDIMVEKGAEEAGARLQYLIDTYYHPMTIISISEIRF